MALTVDDLRPVIDRRLPPSQLDLTDVDPDEVERCLIALLDELVAHLQASPAAPSLDLEKLTGLGIQLGAAANDDLGNAVVDWLAGSPDARRLDATCLLLMGVWAGPRGAPSTPPKTLALDKLLDTSSATALDADSAASLVALLCQLLQADMPRPLQHPIAKALDDVISNESPTLAPMRDLLQEMANTCLQQWSQRGSG